MYMYIIKQDIYPLMINNIANQNPKNNMILLKLNYQLVFFSSEVKI
jgi:hypothetical protein